MAWLVYIIECNDKVFYTGICGNLKKRIDAHNKGLYKGSFTKGRLPVKLVYWERLLDRFEAASREKIIKGYSRYKKARLINSLHRMR